MDLKLMTNSDTQGLINVDWDHDIQFIVQAYNLDTYCNNTKKSNNYIFIKEKLIQKRISNIVGCQT